MTQKLEYYCNQLTHASDPDYVTKVCNESFHLFSYFNVIGIQSFAYIYIYIYISVASLACKF